MPELKEVVRTYDEWKQATRTATEKREAFYQTLRLGAEVYKTEHLAKSLGCTIRTLYYYLAEAKQRS